MAAERFGADTRRRFGSSDPRDITLPLKEVSGPENVLTMIYRVTYAKDKNRPVYFSQHFTVPKIEDDAKGDAYLEGTFDVGEGCLGVGVGRGRSVGGHEALLIEWEYG